MSLRSFIRVGAMLLLISRPLWAQNPYADAHPGMLVVSEADLRTNGVYGFPQELSQVLADTPALRFSVWSNTEFLYAQAVLWTDNDSAIGQTRDHRPIGDHSELWFDLNTQGPSAGPDLRAYMLNPWPNLPGLHYVVSNGQQTTPIQSDTAGRGAIRYVATPAGRRIRVDSFLIPLEEISSVGLNFIRLVFYANSPQPQITVNSAGFNPGQPYFGADIPLGSYQDYYPRSGGMLSARYVPDGRYDPAPLVPRRH